MRQHQRGKAAAGHQTDRWHNSGGSKAARDLPTDIPRIRRRYGSILQTDGSKFRYHEYKLVDRDLSCGPTTVPKYKVCIQIDEIYITTGEFCITMMIFH